MRERAQKDKSAEAICHQESLNSLDGVASRCVKKWAGVERKRQFCESNQHGFVSSRNFNERENKIIGWKTSSGQTIDSVKAAIAKTHMNVCMQRCLASVRLFASIPASELGLSCQVRLLPR